MKVETSLRESKKGKLTLILYLPQETIKKHLLEEGKQPNSLFNIYIKKISKN